MYENQQKEILQETSDSVCDGSIAYRAFTGSFSGRDCHGGKMPADGFRKEEPVMQE